MGSVAEVTEHQLRADLAEALHTVRQLKEGDARAEVVALEKIIGQIGPFPIPPELLRQHVGAQASASKHLTKGQRSAKKVVEVFGESPVAPILDWGCGVGRTRWWLDRLPAWREWYRGTDVDREAIAWLEGFGVQNLSVCTDTAIALPYADGELGGLFSFSVLTHIEPVKFRAWTTELRRVLKPGAIAYLTFNETPVGRLDPVGHATYLSEYRGQGNTWILKAGHYKSAAFVSHEFMARALDDLFEVIEMRHRDYGDMDAAICRAV
jgi:SAM-dependent methyltransferase